MRILLSIGLLGLLFLSANAQMRYTDYLSRQVPGWGIITIHQDEELSTLVNGRAASGVKQEKTDSGIPYTNDRDRVTNTTGGVNLPAIAPKTKHKVNGYRVQLYAGGNSRTARQEANSVGQRCKSHFPDVTVYTHFFPPRWVCRVGDFKTYEEAHSFLREIQATKLFKEASIIKTQIILFY